MLTIRPFERNEEEYDWVVGLNNQTWPDQPETLAGWKHFEKSADPKRLYREIVAEKDGQRVGYGIYCEPWWSYEPGRFFTDLMVDRAYQQQGVAKAMWYFISDDLKNHQPHEILSRTREDKPAGITFLQGFGFERTMRYPQSELRLDAFDFGGFAPTLQRVEAEGIRIHSLTELRQLDPDWKQKLYELRWTILQDVPSPNPRTKPTLEEYETRFLKNPDLEPDANFIALDGERFVGYSNLWPCPGLPKWSTGLSGVVQDYRRKGVCTALKVQGLKLAQQRGIETVDTENEENNPMYQLNLRLGFKPKPAWLDFKKIFPVKVER